MLGQAQIASVVVALALLPACGAAGTAQAPSPPPQPTGETVFVPPEGPPIDWNNLDNPVKEVPAVEAAAPLLPFTPIRPAGLGAPSRIVVDDPTVAPLRARGLALRYDHPDYGLFWVTETRPPQSISAVQLQASLESLPATCEASEVCKAKLTVETIRGGIRALLQISSRATGATSITWYEGGIEFNVIGPPSTFSGEEAVAIANML